MKNDKSVIAQLFDRLCYYASVDNSLINIEQTTPTIFYCKIGNSCCIRVVSETTHWAITMLSHRCTSKLYLLISTVYVAAVLSFQSSNLYVVVNFILSLLCDDYQIVFFSVLVITKMNA